MKRDLMWLSALVVAVFGVLAGLGFWQLQRFTFKQGLIERIEARTRAAPLSLAQAIEQWENTRDIEYLRVRLEGRFQHANERHYFTVIKDMPGWRVITPLATPSGRIVMTDRGFVPDGLKQPEARAAGQSEGLQIVTGLARASGTQNPFVPDNSPEKNTWFWRDLGGMASSTLSAAEIERLAPFFVELDATPVPGGWPKGGVTRLELPNKHLQYAVTWFGLAGTLLAVFAVYLRGRFRRRPFT